MHYMLSVNMAFCQQCNPNLDVHVVWINTLDPQLPHICLYAKRDINRDEELTFDYTSGEFKFDCYFFLTRFFGQLMFL